LNELSTDCQFNEEKSISKFHFSKRGASNACQFSTRF
jgi:hypothetical protein